MADRKAVISAKLRGAGKLTLELIQQTLDAYLDEDVEVYFDAILIFDFTNDIGKPDNLEALKKQLEEIIPAHLGIDYIFRYRTWGELNPYSWNSLAGDTWEAVRENENIASEKPKTREELTKFNLNTDTLEYPKSTDNVDIAVLNNNTAILDAKKLEAGQIPPLPPNLAKETTEFKIENNTDETLSNLRTYGSDIKKLEGKIDTIKRELTFKPTSSFDTPTIKSDIYEIDEKTQSIIDNDNINTIQEGTVWSRSATFTLNNSDSFQNILSMSGSKINILNIEIDVKIPQRFYYMLKLEATVTTGNVTSHKTFYSGNYLQTKSTEAMAITPMYMITKGNNNIISFYDKTIKGFNAIQHSNSFRFLTETNLDQFPYPSATGALVNVLPKSIEQVSSLRLYLKSTGRAAATSGYARIIYS